jgi:hypothetical protein
MAQKRSVGVFAPASRDRNCAQARTFNKQGRFGKTPATPVDVLIRINGFLGSE